ncbi:MAG: 1-deoxy-D-xylulose-5-phosphate synthase [Patescibacteria group bacterium]|nr:1-deoxy-D-xylulose-5-phosphate synthase [Patescibacteria group bacterium]
MKKKGQKKYNILCDINDSADVRALSSKQLQELGDDVREFLIESVAQTGGHFGSNLGVVELTVALHHVFDTPRDRIIWDVGHQAYPHKILTGRKDKFCTIRQKDGLTPFPKRSESEYDAFGVGHSATSISAAIGMERANCDKKNPPYIVAVIGDGALTGGMAFEALNHAGDIESDILVILNDNKMSISPNVGAMHKHLTQLISSKKFQHLRRSSKEILSKKAPTVHEVARRAELSAKGMITQGVLFEELGFGYYGPIDGHDINALVNVLENVKDIKGPRLLHIITEKGKGYKYAKSDSTSLHAVSPFDPKTGTKVQKNKKKGITYTEVFGTWINKRASRDKKLHAITPAMCEGSGLAEFRQKFPKRYHDVGIAEQHAVTFAAGLACEGKKPVVTIYSTFLQRAYDQFIHDVAIQGLDVMFAVDRAGIVGPDGATHAGSFDFSFLRCVPHAVVMAPADLQECTRMLDVAYDHDGPTVVRYPRGGGQKYIENNDTSVEIGKGQIVRHGRRIAILAFGAMVERCLGVADEFGVTIVNMRFVKPLDTKLLDTLAKTHDIFITVEDNSVVGGAGSGINEYVLSTNMTVNVKNLGLPDEFTTHGTRDEILDDAGLSQEKIMKFIAKL